MKLIVQQRIDWQWTASAGNRGWQSKVANLFLHTHAKSAKASKRSNKAWAAQMPRKPTKRVRLNPSKKPIKRAKLEFNGKKPIGRVRLDEPKPSGKPSFDNPRPGPGRPLGSLNKVTSIIRNAAMGAMEQVGYDGKGLDGTLGYMRRLAIQEPATFAGIIKRIMPVRVTSELDPNGIAARMLQVIAAQKALADGSNVIDVPQLPKPPASK